MELIGREREIAELQKLLLYSDRGDGQTAMLSGEAGIGKTRLMEELASIAKRMGAVVLVGRSLYQGSEPYLPFIEALRGVPERPTYYPVGFTGAWSDERERLFDKFFFSVVDASKDSLVLLMLDDLHWADASTLELLHYMARNLAGKRVMIVGTYRKEERASSGQLEDTLGRMAREKLFRELELSRFTEDECARMVEKRLGKINPAIVEKLFRETEGNPFFLQEVLEGMSAGALASEVAIPSTIKELLRSRLSRLSKNALNLVRYASALGVRFDAATLSSASGSRDDEFIELLEELISNGVIRDEGNEFCFDHAKMQEVVYDGLNAARRRMVHERIARALEGSGKVFALATHYRLARDKVNGLKYLAQAEEMAERSYAYQDAIAHCKSMLELEDSGESAWKAHMLLAGLYDKLAEPNSARMHCESALKLSEGLDISKRAQALIEAADLDCKTKGLRQAEEKYIEALRIFDRLHDERGMITVYMGLGYGQFCEHRYAEALESCEMARALVEKVNEPKVALKCLRQLGIVHTRLGNYEKGMDCFGKALDYCVSGSEQEEMYLYNSMGFVQLKLGQVEEALHNYNLSLALAKKLCDPRETALSHENIGDAYLASKRYAEALDQYKCSETLKRKFQGIEDVAGVFGLPKTYNGIARILLAQGKIDDAHGYLRASYAIASKCGDVSAEDSIKRIEAECHIAQGNKEEGKRLLGEVLKNTKEPFEREELVKMLKSLE